MTERDYILATNAARIMLALEAVRAIMPTLDAGPEYEVGIPADEKATVLRLLGEWSDATHQRLRVVAPEAK